MQRKRIKIVAVMIVIVSCQNVLAMNGSDWRKRFHAYNANLVRTLRERRRQEVQAGISPEDAQRIKDSRLIGFRRESIRASGGTPKSLLTAQIAHLQPLARIAKQSIVTYMDPIEGESQKPEKRPRFKKQNIFTHVAALGGPSPLSFALSPEFLEVRDSRSSEDELKIDGDQSSDLSERSDVPYCEYAALQRENVLLQRECEWLRGQLRRQPSKSSSSLTRSLPGSRNLAGMISDDEQE